MEIFRKLGKSIFDDYVRQNFEILFESLKKNRNAYFLDLGCGEGSVTLRTARKIGTKNIFALEAFKTEVRLARKNGINARVADLNTSLPYKNETFDVVLSHYSIEHLYNVSGFISEIYRVLKPGGYVIVATDNLNSWLNIIAMIATLQPFSLTRGLAPQTVGNPFAHWNNEEIQDFMKRDRDYVVGAGSHIKVISARALNDAFSAYGFKNIELHGVGYFPFIGRISRLLSSVDPYHSHLLILKAYKK